VELELEFVLVLELELEVVLVLVKMSQPPEYSGLTPNLDSPRPPESELWRSPLPTHRRTPGA
jgi:hypothetical protein